MYSLFIHALSKILHAVVWLADGELWILEVEAGGDRSLFCGCGPQIFLGWEGGGGGSESHGRRYACWYSKRMSVECKSEAFRLCPFCRQKRWTTCPWNGEHSVTVFLWVYCRRFGVSFFWYYQMIRVNGWVPRYAVFRLTDRKLLTSIFFLFKAPVHVLAVELHKLRLHPQ
jgi:hypothetical protein